MKFLTILREQGFRSMQREIKKQIDLEENFGRKCKPGLNVGFARIFMYEFKLNTGAIKYLRCFVIFEKIHAFMLGFTCFFIARIYFLFLCEIEFFTGLLLLHSQRSRIITRQKGKGLNGFPKQMCIPDCCFFQQNSDICETERGNVNVTSFQGLLFTTIKLRKNIILYNKRLKYIKVHNSLAKILSKQYPF